MSVALETCWLQMGEDVIPAWISEVICTLQVGMEARIPVDMSWHQAGADVRWAWRKKHAYLSTYQVVVLDACLEKAFESHLRCIATWDCLVLLPDTASEVSQPLKKEEQLAFQR